MLNAFTHCRIRTKLLLIILIAGLPVILTVCFLLYAKYREDYREAERSIQVTAEAIASQHEAHIEGIHTLLITISQFPEVKQKDKEACTRLLQSILKQNSSSHNIGIADTEGNLIASGVNAKFSIGDRKYFKDALRTKRFSVGEYTVSRAVAKPAIHFALPVLDEAGAVSVVIYATFDLNHFNGIFDAQKLPPNSALNITDHQGFVIHRYPSHPTVKPGLKDRPDLRAYMTGPKGEGVFNEIGRDEVRRILAFKRLQLHSDEAPYMYIRVSIPEKEAMAGIYRYLFLAGGLIVLASVLTLACSRYFAGRFLVTPVERLAKVSQAAREGDLSARTGLAASSDEIGMLAQSFDSMAETLEMQLRERELAYAGLRASEKKFSVVFDKSPITMALTSYPEGVYFEVNHAFVDTFGFSRDEVVGRSTRDLKVWADPLDRNRYLQLIQNEDYIYGFETVVRIKDGSLLNVLFSGGIVDINGSEYVLNAIHDITEQKRLKEQLLQSQKMEAVGQLAGGVAHDFNNLLTPILGYSEMLWKELSAVGGNIERVERIIKAANKARDLTQQLLTFGRKQAMDMQTIDLNNVVTSFADILRRTIRESIAIKLNLITGSAVIRADRTQIEQIIMNLVVNAQDAITDKGVISIETSNVVLDDEYVRNHHDAQPGRYVMLAVSDSGHGMDSETLNHIFEPFFSTKEVGKGTGLGLATVYGIVKQHEGHIWVYSEPDHGTVFKIYFPCIDSVIPKDNEALEKAPHQEKASGTILLVEDNETVRTMVHELLSDCGYAVIGTEDPLLALTLADDNMIDVLVTDVVMPGMNGPELHERLLKTHPGLKVLFMSGYTNNIVAQHVDLRVGANFIQKPFTVAAMIRKLEQIMSTEPCVDERND